MDVQDLLKPQPVMVRKAEPLPDGTFGLAIYFHGCVILAHVKITNLGFSYDPKLPPKAEGWDFESVVGFNPTFKVLTFKIVTIEEFEAGEVEEPRAPYNPVLVQHVKDIENGR